ncbi:MAG: hypothetical protein L3V56_08605 [Candidatus Magnetoovum sp. WYHC-5]|nr:hypothetical protein [Candidatus Magnetoovum sp. WYHC-5]
MKKVSFKRYTIKEKIKNFILGISDVLNIMPIDSSTTILHKRRQNYREIYKRNYSNGFEEDMKNLQSDWVKIGMDIDKAMAWEISKKLKS